MSLVMITGASRGIGRAIALAIADALIKESTTSCANNNGIDDKLATPSSSSSSSLPFSIPLRMVLIARSADSLRETADLVEQKLDCDNMGGYIHTMCHEMDLSDLDSLPEKFGQSLDSLTDSGSGMIDYNSCWLINNAGSLGPLGLASSSVGGGGDYSSSMKELRSAVDLNVTSGIWVSSQFTKTFLTSTSKTHDDSTSSTSGASSTATKSSPLVRIVNISSLCAVEPFPTMSVYCAGKAGREMFHSVLAKEHASNNNNGESESKEKAEEGSTGTSITTKAKQSFKVLNYAPGPCDTEMTDDLAGCNVLDDGLNEYFTSSKRDKTLVKPEDTAKKLVGMLMLDEFESGSHVDYFDP